MRYLQSQTPIQEETFAIPKKDKRKKSNNYKPAAQGFSGRNILEHSEKSNHYKNNKNTIDTYIHTYYQEQEGATEKGFLPINLSH